MQPDWTSVTVSRDLFRLLDTIGKRTGLKKGILIEKAVTFFVKENREVLGALGLSSEEIDRIVGSLELSGEFTIEQEAA